MIVSMLLVGQAAPVTRKVCANPRNWDGATNGGGNVSNDPIRRMEAAADSINLGAAFDAQKSNGLDHY